MSTKISNWRASGRKQETPAQTHRRRQQVAKAHKAMARKLAK